MHSYIKPYEHTTQKVCQELDADFIPIFEETMATDYSNLLCNDGIHPNDEGHSFLANKVWHYLTTNNWVVK